MIQRFCCAVMFLVQRRVTVENIVFKNGTHRLLQLKHIGACSDKPHLPLLTIIRVDNQGDIQVNQLENAAFCSLAVPVFGKLGADLDTQNKSFLNGLVEGLGAFITPA